LPAAARTFRISARSKAKVRLSLGASSVKALGKGRPGALTNKKAVPSLPRP
jgi:hypothetical protein